MKKTIIRTVAVLAAAALTAALMPLSALAQGTHIRDIWDGSIAEDFAGGSGTENDPFLISNGAQLALLSENVDIGMTYQGSYFALTEDIYLNDTTGWESWSNENPPANAWKPIGGRVYHEGYYFTTMYFQGNFDGCGHSVFGVFYYNNTDNGMEQKAGLFGAAGNCSITNLSVKESKFIIEHVAVTVGAVAGLMLTSEDDTGHVIENCSSDCIIVAPMFAGGIVGRGNTTIVNCTSRSRIEAGSYSGGIAGGMGGAIIGCVNEGSLIAQEGNEYSHCFAGIAGTFERGIIEDCANFGSIVCPDSTSAGGIVGMSDDGEGADVDIRRCSNHGSIICRSGAAGIISYDGDSNVRIENCYNCGSVQSNGDSGGIVGYMWSNSSTGSVEITTCYNVGTVEGETAHALIAAHNEYDEPDTVNCYYLDTCCEAGDEYAEALTDEQLRLEDSYEGFDFETVWTMVGDPDYPYAELTGEAPAQELTPGDVDGDGEVTVGDALIAMRASMGLIDLPSAQLAAADVDGDGEITVGDALLVMRASMGLIEL